MLTPQPYITILRLEREAQERKPRELREFEDRLLESFDKPKVAQRREPRRLQRLALSLRAFLF